MGKSLRMFVAIMSFFGAFWGSAWMASKVDEAEASGACVRKTFFTQGYKEACAKGGQNEAKKFAKAFMKDAIRRKVALGITCNSCHSRLAPDYPLKADGLDNFKKWGGKAIK